MKIIIPKKELKEALVNISKIITGKSSLPILGAVKVSGGKNGIRVTGTNLEQTLTCKISGGEGGGSFIISFKEVKDYLKSGSSNGTVQFEDVGDKISALFHAGNIPVIEQFEQYALNEWPELPEVYDIGFRSDSLFAKISNALPSTSKDSTRKMLQSVLLESDAVVATNGKELIKLHCNTGLQKPVPIPVTKFLESANFAKCSGTIAVEEVNGVIQCRLESDSWVYTTKCIDGNYPNYKQVIPKNNASSIELSSDMISDLVQKIPELESDEEFQTVHLYADGKQIKILPSNYTGKALTVDGTFNGRNPVTISVNRDLLLRSLELGFTKLRFTDGNGFAPIMAKDSKGLFVFMPLQGGDAGKIINAVKMLDSDKGLSFHGKSPDTEVYTPVTPVYKRDIIEDKQQERLMHRSIKNETVKVPLKKEDKMSEETRTNRNQGFQVARNSEKDQFEELLTSIMEVRVKAKEVFDMTGILSKHVKDAQRDQKAREREFKSTRDLLGKLKKVSGF